MTGGNLRPSGRSGSQHPPMRDGDLASAAEELYALSPGDFTAARDERVAQARTSGNRDLARAIGALRRPTVSAWLVNQLAREAGDQVGELLALGESLRRAQQDLAGEQVRELSAQRRRLVAALVTEAKRLAERDGRAVGLQVEREVEATLQAALADADAAAAVRAGCLASPLSYAGLGVGDEAGAVSWQRAPAREKAPAEGQAPAEKKAPARQKAPARERPSPRRGAETAAEREARLAAAEAEHQARQAAAEAERRAAKIAEAEQAVHRAADAVAAQAAGRAARQGTQPGHRGGEPGQPRCSRRPAGQGGGGADGGRGQAAARPGADGCRSPRLARPRLPAKMPARGLSARSAATNWPAGVQHRQARVGQDLAHAPSAECAPTGPGQQYAGLDGRTGSSPAGHLMTLRHKVLGLRPLTLCHKAGSTLSHRVDEGRHREPHI